MPGEIDQSTGQPAVAYVGETPWHRLGERLEDGAPIEEWLRAARLEWEIERLPVQYLVDGHLCTMADRFVLARSDTRAALSIVSGDYLIVQPKEVLEFYRDLVSMFGYNLETAGALYGGRKVWALARTGLTGIAGKTGMDKLAAYVLLFTSCDKTLATTAAFTSIRVVCQNTLSFAIDDAQANKRRQVKVPHNLRFNAEDVKRNLGLIEIAWSRFIEKVQKMVAYPMKPEAASAFFKTVLLPSRATELVSKAQRRDHEALNAFFRSAPGQELETANKTLWGAVNAVSYYTDHVRGSAGGRLDSAWFGAGYALKEKAWVAASDLVG